MLLVAAVVHAMAPGVASAGSTRAASSPSNRAALHAYLLDMYAYVQTVAKAAPAIVGAYEGAASRIAGECPRVLVGAPQGSGIEIGSSILRLTARQRGEEKRQSTQLSDLEEELVSELNSAEQEPRRPAEMALLANLEALPQGGPVLSRIVHAQIVGLEEAQKVESHPDACADMKVWAGSGYRTLSQASRAIAQKHEAEIVRFFRSLGKQSASESTLSLTESPADKALVRKTIQLERRTAETVTNSFDNARKRVEAALGLTVRAKREEERVKRTSHESQSSTKIGAGRTAAGTSYTVWLIRTKGGPGGTCKSRVEVRRADGVNRGILELLTGGREDCLAPRGNRSRAPSIHCTEGLLTIKTTMPAATRTVDLRMSNGAQIISRPVLVPRRLGGPDAFYYQAVKGPSPLPVSLIERDARGHTLRVLKLRQIVGCSKHPLKYLPGGRRTLVRGGTPQGPRFSIASERYRLFGRLHTQLRLNAGEALVSSDEEEEGEGEGQNVAEGPNGTLVGPVKRATPLDSEVSAACHPHEYSIFYGLLKQPRDTVLAKIAGKLVPGLRVPIPSSLHTDGILVYLASVNQPEEILVRSPKGKTLMDEDRSRAAREGRETCEGESEGPGPPPGGFGGTGETSRIVLADSSSKLPRLRGKQASLYAPGPALRTMASGKPSPPPKRTSSVSRPTSTRP